MALDSRISEAINSASIELGQEPALAAKIIAWFEQLANGNTSLDDRQATNRYLQLLYDETTVEIEDEDAEAE